MSGSLNAEAKGSVVYNGDGTFTYTPAAGEEGTVSFDYTITDADGDISTATVTITLMADSEPTVNITRAQGDSRPSAGIWLGGRLCRRHGTTTSGTLNISLGNEHTGHRQDQWRGCDRWRHSTRRTRRSGCDACQRRVQPTSSTLTSTATDVDTGRWRKPRRLHGGGDRQRRSARPTPR